MYFPHLRVGVCVPWPLSHCVLQHLLSDSPLSTSLHWLGTGVPILLAHQVSEMTIEGFSSLLSALLVVLYIFPELFFPCFLTEQRVVHIHDRKRLYKSVSTEYCCI